MRKHHLADDLRLRLHEAVQGVADRPLGGVLHGDHAVVGLALLHEIEDLGDGAHREVVGREPELLAAGLVGEGGLGAEVGHREGLLQRERGGDDLLPHRPDAGVREGALVRLLEVAHQVLLAGGRVEGRSLRLLHLAHFQGESGALVQEIEEALVHRVDGDAKFTQLRSSSSRRWTRLVSLFPVVLFRVSGAPPGAFLPRAALRGQSHERGPVPGPRRAAARATIPPGARPGRCRRRTRA